MARAVLVVAMLTSAGVLLYVGRGQTIQQDALFYADRLATEPLGHALLHAPPNKYLIAVPLLLYDGMFNAFGLGADLPYRLVVTVLVLLCAGLFYVLARRRVGGLAALAPTVLLLFFGSGWETVITAIRIPSLLAVTFGLGALVALERRGRRGYIAAAVLLAASVASHPVGLAFLAAAGVIVVLGGSTYGWRRLWLLAPAIVTFGGWWLFLRTTAPTVSPTAGDVLTFITQSWTAMSADVTGLAGVIGHPSFQQVAAKILAAGLAALALALVLPRLRRVPATLWAALAGLIVIFASARLAPQGFFVRQPDDVRYLFPAAVLFLWLVIETLGVVRRRALVVWGVLAVLGLGLAYNVARLIDGSGAARAGSETVRGQYAAYELAGNRADRGYSVIPVAYPTAGEYLSAAKTYGSAAEPLDQLGTAPLATRQAADQALAGSLDVGLHAARWTPGRAGPPPSVRRTLSGRSTRAGKCLRLHPGHPEPGLASVPVDPHPSFRRALARSRRGLGPPPVRTVPDLAELGPLRGDVLVRAHRIGGVAVVVGMFAPLPSAQLDRLPRGQAALLRLPGGLPRPWSVMLAASEPITVCGLG